MEEHDKVIIEQFTLQSKKFGNQGYPLTSTDILDWAVKSMPLKKSDVVLDAAAGTGILSLAVSPHVKSVTAVDITEAMLQEGRRTAAEKGVTNVMFAPGSVYSLKDEEYDIVMSRLALHHLTRPREAIKQMVKAVKKGGTVAIIDVVSSVPETAEAYNKFERLRDSSHVRALAEDELCTVMRECGLCDVRSEARDVVNRLEAWMDLTETPKPVREEIIKAVNSELKGVEKTGLRPYLENGEIKFLHRWAIATGRK